MSKQQPSFGFDLLRRQSIAASIDVIDGYFANTSNWAEGDSEIERLFHAALIARVKFGWSFFEKALTAPSADDAERGRTDLKEKFQSRLIVERQSVIGEFRVDFLISAWTDGRVGGGIDGPSVGQPRWRKLVVECDGHQFHERTKEQAAKDRSRDRKLTSLGFDVFRFTGSELWCDPWGCASQVYDWAERGTSMSKDLFEGPAHG